MEDTTREEQKAIIKEAIHEWLDEKYAQFGKWTLHGVGAAIFAFTIYWLTAHGWIK